MTEEARELWREHDDALARQDYRAASDALGRITALARREWAARQDEQDGAQDAFRVRRREP
jgi:hypothetical protein